MKKRNIVICGAVLLVLIAAIAVLSLANRPDTGADSSVLTVKHNGETVKSYTFEQLAAMQSVTRYKAIASSSFSDEEGNWQGIPLCNLISDAGIELAADGQITAVAADGYAMNYSAADILGSDSALLIYAKDGSGLGTMDDGGSGPFRILFMDDEFGSRSAKYVCEIDVK